MEALDAFFFEIDEQNDISNAAAHQAASEEAGVQSGEQSPHRRYHRAGECDFAAMDKHGPQWSKWTGNLPVSSDLQRMVNHSVHPTQSTGEVLKVPFKSSAWLRGNKNKTSTLDAGRRMPTAETIESFTGTHISQLSDSFSEIGVHETEPNAAAHFQQSAYGKVCYEPKPFNQHWHDLTLTECLMASPFFQQLSSEKFSALEHFAVLRSFKDNEIVLSKEQKFYDVFFIRYVTHFHLFVFRTFLSHVFPASCIAYVDTVR